MSNTGLYKIRTVSTLTGFSPALLRAWESRHGLLEPERGEGGHRLYTQRDLEVLGRVRKLLDAGRSIGEIARLGRERLAPTAYPGPIRVAGPPREGKFESETALVPRFEELERLRDAIVSGAVAIDGATIDRALDEAFSRVSPELVLANVVEPAAKEIGLLWSRGRCSVAGEHLASNLFLRRLQNLVGSGGKAPPDSPLILSACFEGELHALGALVVAFHLSKAGMRVAYLGPDLPIEDLEASVSVLAPRVVFLSVAREEAFFKGFAGFLGFAARQCDRVLVYLGGRGVPDDTTTLTAAGVRVWPSTRPVSELPMALAAELNRAPSLPANSPTASPVPTPSPVPPASPGPSPSHPQLPQIEGLEPRQAAKAGVSRRRRRS